MILLSSPLNYSHPVMTEAEKMVLAEDYVSVYSRKKLTDIHVHLIPKWRITVTWPSMPCFRAALPRSSRATAILDFILFIHFIYFAT